MHFPISMLWYGTFEMFIFSVKINLVPNVQSETPILLILGSTPNENREVVLYDHFAGDNSSLKFMIKFRFFFF